MFEVGVVAQFEAAHSLRGNFGPATRLHGHTYRVEVSVRGESLRPDGTLLDITVLQDAAEEVVTRLHFRNLDEIDLFTGRNTTAETVALVFFEQIAPGLRGLGLSSLSVRVWESPRAYGAYEGVVEG